MTWERTSRLPLYAAASIALIAAGPGHAAKPLVLKAPAGARDLHFIFDGGACVGLTGSVTFTCNKQAKPPQVEAAWTGQVQDVTITAGLIPADGEVYQGALAAGKWRYVTLAAWSDENGNYLPDTVIPFADYGGIVPEPGTWVMMLAGVFGLGALRRRGRRPRPEAQADSRGTA